MKRWSKLGGSRFWYWMPQTLLSILVLAAPTIVMALSQGYRGPADLVAGSLVSLDPQTTGVVQAANTDRAGELLGVVVESNQSLIAASNSDTDVQVVTNGTALALVSTLNGDIHKGDAISASPINGVGMRAIVAGRILGIAQTDFSAKSDGAISKQVKTKTGEQTISLGQTTLLLSVGYFTPRNNSSIPEPVQNLARLIVGKDVSPIRIVLAATLLLIGITLSIIIINSAVRSSLESVGRNPLARKAINSGLLKILVLTVAILLLSFGSVYLIIKG